ncbi:MAG: DUF4235 domain-containing protein [Nitrospirota bacterium]|nr:DUF4235 domain-containing protein [Nitrospirota bacterium]
MNKSLERLSDKVFTADNAWTAVGFLAVVLGAGVGRQILKSGWRASTGKEPPLNPDAEDATWLQSLAWGVVTGAIIGMVRAASRSGASSVRRYWS